MHAELALDERRYALACPYLADEPVRWGSFVEPGQNLGLLFGRELACRPRCTALMQGRDAATFASAAHPLRYRPRRDAQCLGDLRLCPASLVQFPGTQSSAFAPVDGST